MKVAFVTLDGVVVEGPPKALPSSEPLPRQGVRLPRNRSGCGRERLRAAHVAQGRVREPDQEVQAEEVGGGEERVLAQQVQEAPHQVGEGGRELSRTGPAGLLSTRLHGDNIGIGS